MRRVVMGTVLMILWVCSILLLPACGPGEADASQAAVPRDLSFTIINDSGARIHSIGVAGANYPIAYSPIDADGRSTIKSKNLKLPETLTVHWTDARGERHEGTVRVWGELSAGYSGPVNLTINHRDKVILSGG